MVQDVSDRKVAEDELERYRAQLEELVKERTEQLEAAQQELVQKEPRCSWAVRSYCSVAKYITLLGTVANFSLFFSKMPCMVKSMRI